jgi:hypothetical protein
MKRPDATLYLWIANLLGWGGLCVVALLQFGILTPRPAAALPEVKALRPAPLAAPQMAADVGTRNPFDPTAGRWLAAAAKSDAATAAADAGALRGILVLPGVRAAVTGAGAVHVGDAFAGGRMVGIRDGKVLVQQEGGAKPDALEVPAMRRQTLKSLNSAVPAKAAR